MRSRAISQALAVVIVLTVIAAAVAASFLVVPQGGGTSSEGSPESTFTIPLVLSTYSATMASSCMSESSAGILNRSSLPGLLVPLLRSVKSMAAVFYGSEDRSPYSYAQSYTLDSVTAVGNTTVYRLGLVENLTSSSQAKSATAWLMSDGSVLAVYEGGKNLTGAYATNEFISLTEAFYVQSDVTTEFAGALNSKGLNYTTVTAVLGPTTIQAVEYQASSLPLTLTFCGYGFYLSAFNYEAGPIPGTSESLLVYMRFKGTETVGHDMGRTTLDFTFRVLALTRV